MKKDNKMCSAFWAGMYFEMVDINHYKLKVDVPLTDIKEQAKFVLAIRGFFQTFITQNEINPITLTIGESDFKVYIEDKKIMDIIHIKGTDDYTGDLLALAEYNKLLKR